MRASILYSPAPSGGPLGVPPGEKVERQAVSWKRSPKSLGKRDPQRKDQTRAATNREGVSFPGPLPFLGNESRGSPRLPNPPLCLRLRPPPSLPAFLPLRPPCPPPPPPRSPSRAMHQPASVPAVRLDMEPLYGKEEPRAPAAPLHPPPPKDFVLWSLFNFGFLNCCCLGFAALVFSVKSRDRTVVGDLEGAASYGKTAKCLNITALVVSLILTTIIIMVYYYIMTAFVQQFVEMLQKRQ